MPYVGGLRSRLIILSFHAMIESALSDLGWLDATIYDDSPGLREHHPVHLLERRPDDEEKEVAVNSIAITPEDIYDDPAEMGSSLTDDTRTFSIDIYAENDAVGEHIAGDLRDVLRGKMASIGRDRPRLTVADFTQEEPTDIFYCDIDRVALDRARNWPKPWQQHWFVVSCDVVDTYGDEDYG